MSTPLDRYADLEGHATTTFQATIWIYGGKLRKSQQFVFNMLRLTQDQASRNWELTEMTVAGTPFPRWFHASCMLGGSWFIHGGLGPEGFDSNYLIHKCELSNQTVLWSNARTSGSVPSMRCNHSMTGIHGGELLMFGGFALSGDIETMKNVDSGNAYVLNLTTLMWQTIEISMLPHTWGQTLCNPFHGATIIFLFGGTFVDSSGVLSMWSVDLDRMACAFFDPPQHAPPGRLTSSLTYCGATNFLVYGGLVDEEPQNDLWLVDTQDGSWTPLPHGPFRTKCHAAVFMGSAMVVIGGNDQSLLQVFDCQNGVWDSSLDIRAALTRNYNGKVGFSKMNADRKPITARLPVLLKPPATTAYVPPKPKTPNHNLALVLSVISIRMQQEASGQQQQPQQQHQRHHAMASSPQHHSLPNPQQQIPYQYHGVTATPLSAEAEARARLLKTPNVPNEMWPSPANPTPIPSASSPVKQFGNSPSMQSLLTSFASGGVGGGLNTSTAAAPSNIPPALEKHYQRAFKNL